MKLNDRSDLVLLEETAKPSVKITARLCLRIICIRFSITAVCNDFTSVVYIIVYASRTVHLR